MAAFMLLAVIGVAAQGTSSSVRGVVRDPAGHLITRATVILQNEETGVSRTSATQRDGIFLIPEVEPGAYDLQISSPGFSTNIRRSIEVLLGQKLQLDTVLTIGVPSQVVTVSTALPLVYNSTEQVGGIVEEREIKNLPLNGRSFDNLITLNAATVNSTSLKLPGASNSQTAGNNFAIAGRRPGETLFVWNGVEFGSATNDDNGTPGGASGQLLGIEAVREFSILTTIDSSDVGHRAGGQVRVVTKSGSNQLHGSVYEFVRNGALDARNFFDVESVPPFRRNQFGAALGGPLRRNRTFLFGNYEGFRQHLLASSVAVVPDTEARNGRLPDASGAYQPVEGYNPAIEPYFALWPLPNGPELLVNGLPTGTALSYNTSPNPIHEDFGTLRLDHLLRPSDSLIASYTIDDGENTTPEQNPYEMLVARLRTHVLTIEEAHTFSPNLLNSLTLGYTRPSLYHALPISISPPGVQPFVAGYPIGQIKIGSSAVGSSGITVAGSGPNTGSEQHERASHYTVDDHIQWTSGRHAISIGGRAQHARWSEESLTYGRASFTSLTDFLQAAPSNISVQLHRAFVPWSVWSGAWFAQDTIQLRRNLSVSLGLRHEFTNGFNSTNNTAVNYVPDADGVIQTKPRIGRSLFTVNNARWLFGPRAGLAWDPFGTGKTSVRLGFGIAYNLLDSIGYCCFSTNPAFASLQLNKPPFPFQIDPTIGVPDDLKGRATPSGGGIQDDAETPRVRNYRVEIEREVFANTTLRLAYIGSNGDRSLTNVMRNPVAPVACGQAGSNCPPALASGALYFPANGTRLNPSLGPVTEMMTLGVNNYNALAVDLNRRFRSGFDFHATYTFSKSLDNSSNLASGQSTNNPGVVLNPFDPMLDYGPSAFNIGHRFTANSIVGLPFGRQRAFFNRSGPLGERLIGGWRMSLIVGLQSGFPFTPQLGFNQSRDGNTAAPDRPDWAPGRGPSNAYLRRQTQWFDPTAFALPVAGTYGNVRRNSLNGPGMEEIDLGFAKEISFIGRTSLQLRSEFFNLLNRTNLGLPSNVALTSKGAPASSAGLISTTATDSREIQFSAKLHW